MTRRAKRGEPLSDCEIRTLAAASRGLRNAQIAAENWISIDTVKTQLLTAYTKLGARNRAHAVVIAICLRLIPMPYKAGEPQ